MNTFWKSRVVFPGMMECKLKCRKEKTLKCQGIKGFFKCLLQYFEQLILINFINLSVKYHNFIAIT